MGQTKQSQSISWKDELRESHLCRRITLNLHQIVAADVRRLILIAYIATTVALQAAQLSPIISLNSAGKLVYHADERGNRVPDFSHCGYAGGDQAIPAAPILVVVPAEKGDSTARIQKAIDYLATLPVGTNGLRGAVLLAKGRHEVFGGLSLRVSGVVLRGQGMGEGGTVLVAAGEDRRALIRIAGQGNRTIQTNSGWDIADDYVPVGATSFRLRKPGSLKIGDTINVIRPSTQPWIERLGMVELGGGEGNFRWKPGSRDLVWDRIVKSIEDDRVTVDAPITTALESEFGGGRVEAYSWPGRLSHVGVENLRLESSFDPGNPKDENHAWMAITMENVQNAWVRQVEGGHFAGSLVAIYETCRWVTVQDCLSRAPVSEAGGYRRNTFFTMGQMTLFLRCHAQHGRHDFSVGHCAAGPNAFVQCEATSPGASSPGDSGPIESWASGVLYDNVVIDGNALSLCNRGSSAQGAGWAAANSVLWQCQAALLRCENPPTAQNWAFGCWGEFEGDGIWRESNSFIKPESLYAAQLAQRVGRQTQLMPRSTAEATNPTVEQAAQFVRAARQPPMQLPDYIAAASTRDPIPTEPGDAKRIEHPAASEIQKSSPAKKLLLTNGWLACDGRLLIGGRRSVSWWRGNIRPNEALTFDSALTRFVPGRIGRGLTDDLDALGDSLQAGGHAALDHNYGLWYDRRRDDHERVRRINGDVCPPFFEQPFARSGQGTAWDGLSRYDLTKFNPWYWARLKDFAGACEQRGLVLFHQNYFQHNLLEAGAHWADFPWRSANNINNTGFPEPPPYAGDKRIFMAEQFYDVTHPVRRGLHRSYIRKCLANFSDKANVIQFTSAEYTGPLSFVEFWLDTIAEWSRETGRRPLVALSCTKDVQDAILADPKRSGLVDVIDFRYWWKTDRGVFEPKGGQNLAPRQFERQWRGGRPGDIHLAQMAAEYRQKFPDKAVICDFDQAGWLYACAGGSMARLPKTTDPELLAALPRMRPARHAEKGALILEEPGNAYLVYATNSGPVRLALEAGKFALHKVRVDTGTVELVDHHVADGREFWLPIPEGGKALYWLKRTTEKTNK
jgi:hypothetical protein